MGHRKTIHNIVHLIEWHGGIGGAEQLTFQLVSSLDRSKYCPSLVMVGDIIPSKLPVQPDVRIIRIKNRRSINLKLLSDIVAAFRELDADLIQSHFIRMNTYNWMASRIIGRKSIATLHGIFDEHKTFTGKIWSKLSARYNTKVIVVSHFVRQEFLKLYNCDRAKINFIHNGFDRQKIAVDPGGECRVALTQQYNIDPRAMILLGVGNIRPIKGFEYTIRAMNTIRATNENVWLLLVGSDRTEEAERLKKLAHEMAVDDRVIFCGTRNDMASFYAAADIFICSSLYEGFSLVTLEAMASGLPVVVSRCGGPEEFVRHNETGWLTPTGKAEAIAEAIMGLLSDPLKMEAFGQQAQRWAREEFSMEKCVAAYQTLYADLIKGGELNSNEDAP